MFLSIYRGQIIKFKRMYNKVVDRNSIQKILRKRKISGKIQYRILWKNKIKTWENISNLGSIYDMLVRYQKKKITYKDFCREKSKTFTYNSTDSKTIENKKRKYYKQKSIILQDEYKNNNQANNIRTERQCYELEQEREKEQYNKNIKKIIRVRYNKQKRMEEVLVIFNNGQESEKWQEKQKVRRLAIQKLLQFYEFFCEQLKSFKILKQ